MAELEIIDHTVRSLNNTDAAEASRFLHQDAQYTGTPGWETQGLQGVQQVFQKTFGDYPDRFRSCLGQYEGRIVSVHYFRQESQPFQKVGVSAFDIMDGRIVRITYTEDANVVAKTKVSIPQYRDRIIYNGE